MAAPQNPETNPFARQNHRGGLARWIPLLATLRGYQRGWLWREKEPFAKYPPPAPRHDQGLPYGYGFVRRWNSPMWWRIPTATELQAMEA